MNGTRTGIVGVALAAGLILGGVAYAENMTMEVELTGSQEVPPVETSANGKIEVTFDSDTRMLSWELDYSGLSGAATAAHFHGPADPGENAPPVIALEEFGDGSKGSVELPEEHSEQLVAGKLYFNIHTEQNPNGELRGQITAAQ